MKSIIIKKRKHEAFKKDFADRFVSAGNDGIVSLCHIQSGKCEIL